jgi:hypothetical protein
MAEFEIPWIPNSWSMTMKELHQRLRGYNWHSSLRRWILRIDGVGFVYVNSRVVKRYGGIEGVLDAPDRYIASFRRYNNGMTWLYRVASQGYVDIPPQKVVDTLIGFLRGVKIELDNFGKWGNRISLWDGAVYGELTARLGWTKVLENAEILLRVEWGDDGFHAFRTYLAIADVNTGSAMVLNLGYRARASKRVFHSRLTHNTTYREKVVDVMERITQFVKSTIAIAPKVEQRFTLMRNIPVRDEDVDEISKHFNNKFMILWRKYSQKYGKNMLALFEVLGWYAAHGTPSRRENALREMRKWSKIVTIEEL